MPPKTHRGAEGMSNHHKDQLIDALMYYLPMDVRAKIVRDVPAAYNAYCGSPVAQVSIVSDGRVIS